MTKGNGFSPSTPTSTENSSAIQRSNLTSTIIIAATGLCILALTLFPYDFFFVETIADFTWAGLMARAHRPILMPLEFIANIVMFVPLGFGFALKLRKQTVAALLLILWMSLIATLTIESLQIFLPSRTPSHTDLIANTAGGGLGFALWRCWQPVVQSPWFHSVQRQIQSGYSAIARPLGSYWQIIKPRPNVQRQIIAIALCSYCCLTLWGTASLRNANRWGLSNWDSTYPLLLGNELEGDRPWDGQISNVQIYDRQLESTDIQQLLAQPERSLNQADDQSTTSHATPIAHYPLSGSAPYTDQTAHLPDLTWQGEFSPNPSRSASAVTFSPQRWLSTQSPSTQLIEQVKAAEAFTISLTAKSNSNEQTGPARILSLSKGPLQRNLTIGQKGSHLSLRLRTPITKENGQRPEFFVPNVFSVNQPHHLILTYSANRLALYVDTLASSRKIIFSPEMTLFWQLAPPVLSTIQLNSATSLICQLLYRGLWLIPIGIIFLFTLNSSSKKRSNNKQFQMTIIAITALFYGLLEVLLH